MSAWVYRKDGANASWYVGWYEQGRRRTRSCGPGDAGKDLADRIKLRIDAALASCDAPIVVHQMHCDLQIVGAEQALPNERFPDGQGGKELVYFVEAVGLARIKIGIAVNVARRFAALDQASPVPLRLLGVEEGGRVLESKLHQDFASCRVRGEWFEAVAELGKYIETFARPLRIHP
jgi:hypothetical protein